MARPTGERTRRPAMDGGRGRDLRGDWRRGEPRDRLRRLGGAIITWQDYCSGTYYDIYAQRVSAGGVVLWAANGIVLLHGEPQPDDSPDRPDGSGGAIVAWQDGRGGATTISTPSG